MRQSWATTDIRTKSELVSACTLGGYAGKTVSIESLCKKLRLSPAAVDALKAPLKNAALFSDHFQLSAEVLDRAIAFRTEELNNGAMLTADAARFDEVFHKDNIPNTNEVKYTTQGALVDQRIRRTK